jgi:peptidoglycan hydrolase CwlO-like protein
MNQARVRIARLLSACLLTLPILLTQAPVTAHADEISQLQQQLAAEEQQLAQITAQMANNGQQIASLQGNLAQLQAVLADLGVKLAGTQANLEQNQALLAQIQAREDTASAQLADTQKQLDRRQAAFNAHMRALDKLEHAPLLEFVLTSSDFEQFFRRITDAERVIAADRELAAQLKQSRDQVQQLRDQLERDRQAQAKVVAQIAAQRAALDQEYSLQDRTRRAITATEGQLEARQRQLDQQSTDLGNQIIVDQSQLNSLLAFTSGRIGSGGQVIAPEIMGNAWGAYYNQRDARWGNDYVGASSYLVWEIGCLLSDVAMVNTHFGNSSVTPATIALNSNNFTSDGLMYNSALNVPGHPANINNRPTADWIRSWLASGRPVIAGMYISGGTHFVTLTGNRGSNDYWMNDPWNPRAMQVSFNSSNVTGPIFEAIAYS